MDKLLLKVGFYSVYERIIHNRKVYVVDNGKIIYSNRFKKYFPNPNRDVKEFNNLDDAKKYAQGKIKKHAIDKKKKLEKLPKSIYLIVMKEETTGKVFVKVGITSKRFILRRFSKDYGYEGYTLETILRRIDTKDAEKLEEVIKDKLNKKRGVKKFKPLLENFSGYSECYSHDSLNEIITIFDTITKGC
jgi:DNA-binding Lrp family transcriptional regulator